MNPSGDDAMLMRLSVPAEGGLRAVAAEVARKLAEHLGGPARDADAMTRTLDGLATRVSDSRSGDITFEFRESNRELVILAWCSGRSSEARYPLTA